MSKTDWNKIQRRLEGRCTLCNGTLPEHYGVCPKHGEEILREYQKRDDSVGQISDAVKKLLKRYGKDV